MRQKVRRTILFIAFLLFPGHDLVFFPGTDYPGRV